MLHRVGPTLANIRPRDSANAGVSTALFNLCSEQSAYGNGAGVAAARGHLDVPVIVALEPSVVSDVGLRFSSGVGLGVVSDFELAPRPAPWLASCPTPLLAPCPAPRLAPCPAPSECRAPEDGVLCGLKLLSAPCL